MNEAIFTAVFYTWMSLAGLLILAVLFAAYKSRI